MHILRFYALWKWSMSQIGPKGEKKCSGKGTRIVHLTLLWHLRLTMKLGSRLLHTLNSKAVFCVKYDPNRANKKVYICSEKIICVSQYDLDLWPTNFIQDHCTGIDHRHSVSEVWARLNKGERRYAQDNGFSYTYNSAMTFRFNLKTWFKVTAYPLPESTL